MTDMSRYSDTSNIASILYFAGIDPRAARSMSATHPGGIIENRALHDNLSVTCIGRGMQWAIRHPADSSTTWHGRMPRHRLSEPHHGGGWYPYPAARTSAYSRRNFW